jgi:7-cyano-7-deazaguanine synthase
VKLVAPERLGAEALVLLSGGQDSTTCLFWAKRSFTRVAALSFRYGQRHEIELLQAAKIAEMAGAPMTIIDLEGTLGNSALLAASPGDVNQAHPDNSLVPASFVPGRNLLFLAVAGAHAFNRGIGDIVTGMCQTDFSGYPDCRRDFADSMERTLSLAMAPAAFRIHTPLMDLDKADTFRMAETLGVLDLVLEHSHTDYHGDRAHRHPWGYGNLDNEASRLRARGWFEYRRRYFAEQIPHDA